MDMTTILAEINKRNFSFPNRFVVSVHDDSNNSMFNAVKVGVPGRKFEIEKYDRFAIGYYRNQPVKPSLDDLDMTMRCSEDFREFDYWLNWMDKIYSVKTLRFGYYDNYIKDVDIITYGRDNQPKRHVRYLEAAPSIVQKYELDMDQQNTIVHFLVNLVFYEQIVITDFGGQSSGTNDNPSKYTYTAQPDYASYYNNQNDYNILQGANNNLTEVG